MYITYGSNGSVTALYDNKASMPESAKANAVYVKSKPERPEGVNCRLTYSKKNGLRWEEVKRMRRPERPVLENPADRCRLIMGKDKTLQWEIIPGTLTLSRAAITATLEGMKKDKLLKDFTAAAGAKSNDKIDFNDPDFQKLWTCLKKEKLASRAFLARAGKK